MLIRIAFSFIFLFTVNPLLCQVQNIKFEHKGAETVLSHANILCIFQDSRGFMWFGSKNGLSKYDGYTFTFYRNDEANKNSLSNDKVVDLAEDRDGNLWIATVSGGLDMFDWRQEKFIHYKYDPKDSSSISSKTIHCITIDHDDNPWVGTAGGGLCMLDRKVNKFVRYPQNDNDRGTKGNSVHDLLEDHEQNVWIGMTSDGLSMLDRKTNTFKHFLHDPQNTTSLANNKIEVLFQDRKKRLWIGTREGLDLFDGKEFRHFRNDPKNENSLASDVVLSLEEDNEGNLWIGTENGGLSILNIDAEIFYNYKQDDIDRHSLNNNSIWSLYKDRQGNMWVGTFSGGINFVNHNSTRFKHYRHTTSPLSLSQNSIWEIFEDSKMNLWIGTDGGGLNLFDRKSGKFTSYKNGHSTKSISGNHVLSLAEDQKGNIWIGTWGEGLTVFNKEKNTYRHFVYEPGNLDGISSPNIWSIYKDRKGTMWIGTNSNGVNVYDEKRGSFIHYKSKSKDKKSLGHNTVNVFFEDSQGTMWVGTNGGLSRFNKIENNFTRYTHSDRRNSVSYNHVLCLLEDNGGNLWVGTEVGLNYFNTTTQTFTNYYMKDGLPSNAINSLLLDEKDNLWIGTNNGISKFNPTTKAFKNFGVSDGLQSNEFRKGACKSKTGQFYFGGTNGLNEFRPSDVLVTGRYDPPLHLTGFEIFNKSVPISTEPNVEARIPKSILDAKEIQLSYDQTVFSIQFASLNYINSENRLYSYWLEGFDKDWNALSTTHSATYTNLDPGEYTFKVRGLNSEGSWSKNTAELKITIIPPVWKTWWFKIFAGLLIASSIVLAFLLRTRNVTNINRQLAEAVSQKTKEINDKNRILFQQREELAAQNEELLQSHEEISSQRDLVAKQNQTLESEVKKRTHELVEYNYQLEQFAFISAHNLRAPVARILGLGNLLDISNGNSTENKEIYPRLVNATKELDNVVKDLNTILYFKKNSDSIITDIDLRKEFTIIIENLDHEISTTHANITTNFSEVGNVRTVKPYFDSIIYNLVSNAIKYRHPDRTPIINIKSQKIENEVCISFADNGLGIDVDLFQDKIFTLYSRFHSHVEGKGMGLYLVKTQLASMGGRITLDSTVDVGTTFKIYLKL